MFSMLVNASLNMFLKFNNCGEPVSITASSGEVDSCMKGWQMTRDGEED